jgi:cytochrome c-type protein NapB
MIPHSVEGMLPIKINNNQCKTCHVDSAPYDKTIPSVPPSHFTNFRPSSSYALKHANTSSEDLAHVSIKKENKLVGARFNCSQCHAPQATIDPIVESNFKASYTKKDGAHKSSWNGKEFMKDIKTIK